jgi:uncharacterized protein with HEPN domain
MPSLPSDRPDRAPLDIVENIALARSFLGVAAVADLMADRLTFYAVTRCLEVISKAARSLRPQVRDRHPDLPWRSIMGFGNVSRHEYDKMDEMLVWQTVHKSLPALAEAMTYKIDSAGPD